MAARGGGRPARGLEGCGGRRLRALCAGLALVLQGCALFRGGEPALGLHPPRDCADEGWSGLLHGQVREHPGQAPLASVTVTVYGVGMGTTTDAEGTFRMPTQGLRSCAYSLVFSRPGFTTVIADVPPVAPGDSLVLSVALSPLGLSRAAAQVRGPPPGPGAGPGAGGP